MASKIKRFIIINAGLLIMALAFIIFLEPSELAVGGVTGLAMVIQNYFPAMNLGVLMLIFNVILFIVAFVFIGKDFGGYTIYCSFALSFMMGFLEKYMDIGVLFPDDLMLTLIFGILVQGIGMAIVFYQNASTGGTDIVAKVINKYSGMNIGMALFLADSLVTIGAAIAFNFRIGLYAFLGILLNGFVIDKVIDGFNMKSHVQVISKKPALVSAFIQNDLLRGVTYVKTVGGYTKKDMMMVTAVLTRPEYLKLDRFLKNEDPGAFMIMNHVREVKGEGFTIFPTKQYEKVVVEE